MPTGSGKTLTGLNFALRLRDRLIREKGMEPRVIYCVSFISIIDQNSKVFEDAFRDVTGRRPGADTMLRHHHLADIFYDTKESENDYDTLDSLFLVEGWNSEIVFTTFVQFFHSILTNRNRALRKLHRVANSIVLLDEVQSIPPQILAPTERVPLDFQRILPNLFRLHDCHHALYLPRRRDH